MSRGGPSCCVAGQAGQAQLVFARPSGPAHFTLRSFPTGKPGMGKNYYGSRDLPWWTAMDRVIARALGNLYPAVKAVPRASLPLSSYSHWRVTPVRVGPMHKCSTSHSEEEERIEARVRDEAAARGLERLERSVLDIP